MQPKSGFQKHRLSSGETCGAHPSLLQAYMSLALSKETGGGGKGHTDLVPAQSSGRHLLEGGNQKVERLS